MSVNRTQSLYTRLYDTVAPYWRLLVVALLVLAAGSSLLALRLQLDMSFRPLFDDDAATADITHDFENEFGQRSGAFVGVIVEDDAILSDSFLRRLLAFSRDAEAIDHISEVQSLARLGRPFWWDSGAGASWVLPEETIEDPDPVPEMVLAVLRGDPDVRGWLLSEDGVKTLVLARIALPLQDLDGRAPVIHAFEAAARRHFPGSPLHFVGVSVVEETYGHIVLASLAKSLALTMLSLVVFLWIVFRRAPGVIVTMAGVALATPMTLGAMSVMGLRITMINSLVPIVVLIIGVADAVHMQQYFDRLRRRGAAVREAVRTMFGAMALPCMLTTLTTAAGFLCLCAAHMRAIREFGLAVGVGVIVVYIVNLIVVPLLLCVLPGSARPTAEPSWVKRWCRGSGTLVIRHPEALLWTFAVFVAACVLVLPRLRVDQRFNEEVSPQHPVRSGQALLEEQFSGFLGPELSVRMRDGSSLLQPRARKRLRAFTDAVANLPDVLHVESFLDYLPEDELPEAVLRDGLADLRDDDIVGLRVRDVINAQDNRAAVVIRTTDMGTHRAETFVARLDELAAIHLGSDLDAQLVGQWWLAQTGLRGIVHDTVASFSLSCLLILPVLALVLRSGRFFLVGLLPNLLPVLFALAFMAASGISLRIGTAMVLAVALAIAIDDTIHMLVRLKSEERRYRSPARAVCRTIDETGGAVMYTSVVLVAGFLSMRVNELNAIRDMGILAAATLTVALLADVYLAPSVYLMIAILKRRAAEAAASKETASRRDAPLPPHFSARSTRRVSKL